MKKNACFVELAKQINQETRKVTKNKASFICLNGLSGLVSETNPLDLSHSCYVTSKRRGNKNA